eukprot:TRINITY_DN24084_c0_g1_i1.p1 TRINITY_DN24084_c0_g1~~TRINITY_DN24084_c0_g1_i1.p1  ORF type:complete len:112 (+),score=25.71 TRINITY_DN24084_c0_g1_i1:167-502(+)
MDEDDEAREQQMVQLSRWFAFWSRSVRVSFLNGLLDRTEPCDAESAQAMDQMAVASLSGCDAAQRQEVLQSFSWFRAWPDTTRNALMDILEDIDMQAVYDFYDRFAAAKWK